MSNAMQMPDYWALEFLQLNDVAIDLRGRLEKAAEENAKLRELVRDMWALQIALPYGAHIEIRDRMRELGIEVNDG